jgi:hypothetical protein
LFQYKDPAPAFKGSGPIWGIFSSISCSASSNWPKGTEVFKEELATESPYPLATHPRVFPEVEVLRNASFEIAPGQE